VRPVLVSLQRLPFRDFTAEEFLGRTLTTCRGAGGCVSVFQGMFGMALTRGLTPCCRADEECATMVAVICSCRPAAGLRQSWAPLTRHLWPKVKCLSRPAFG
jgi:hypothetical protein